MRSALSTATKAVEPTIAQIVALEATDSDGLTSSNSATIYVDHRASLPLIVVAARA